MDSSIIERLLSFGLTRQEATIYLTLFTDGELTGYEVAKLTGISRSNVYNALSGLVEKGASYIMEGAVTKYTAVPISEFCENKLRALEQEKAFILSNLPEKKQETDRYITIDGQKHIMDKMINMINQADQRIYLYVTNEVLLLLMTVLQESLKQKKKVVLITDKEIELKGALIYYHKVEDMQIQLIADSKYVLTGEVNETCLFSGQRNFVNVFKQSLANTIKLIEYTKGDTK